MQLEPVRNTKLRMYLMQIIYDEATSITSYVCWAKIS